MTAREEILSRIAHALRDVPEAERPEDVAVPRRYASREPADVVERFVARASEYRADVRRVAPAEVAGVVGEICRDRGIQRLGVPSDISAEWLPRDVTPVPADRLTPQELDELGAALTGCALAIAETGTIVLDSGARQGPRALTLVPDHHLCVVDEAQIVGGVPEALREVAAAIRGAGRPVTFVSGPSATSDIELSRVEGVHGPRDLVVLVLA